ncbi:diacylglycerol kinase family lipid kinase [Sporosarcina luteola]|uniref:diacylglycerol/lipid kinase family protein n=1 Tax=Sporosarcina luteola TaxID=582850 RepID=UPI00203F6FD1|nr:diacylglycerol kinase family protein [Sporosarcina luteola]MCM3637539.1 diacylglycerol kinase family lipid kinase [Sporosarcina luteola]
MYVFIINPTSGKGAALKIWRDIESTLLARKIHYEAHICVSPELTRTYMMEIYSSQSIKAFVVVGGDGTVSSVLQQLAVWNIPLAVFPAGSGNDVARNFGLVAEPEQFVELLAADEKILADLLYVNGTYGITVAGIGMDAEIGIRADRSFYKRLLNKFNRGSVAYTISAIIELLIFKPFRGRIFVDGSLILQTDLWLFAGGNLKMYGGGLTICPYADYSDGLIDATILHNAKRWKVLSRLFPDLLKGEPIIAKEVTYLKGKEFIIEGNRKLPYVIDGEIFHADRIHLSIRTKALNLVDTSKS